MRNGQELRCRKKAPARKSLARKLFASERKRSESFSHASRRSMRRVITRRRCDGRNQKPLTWLKLVALVLLTMPRAYLFSQRNFVFLMPKNVLARLEFRPLDSTRVAPTARSPVCLLSQTRFAVWGQHIKDRHLIPKGGAT